jgi:SAM-dependent methyltransferase
MPNSYPRHLRIWERVQDNSLSPARPAVDWEGDGVRGSAGNETIFAGDAASLLRNVAANGDWGAMIGKELGAEVFNPNEAWSNQKARWLFARETLDPSPTGPKQTDAAEPFSLQWFLNIEHQRHQRRGRWIPRLLEFSKHPGETLLCIGNGLGTDWVQYARQGAAVVVCSPSADNLELMRRNFEVRGLSGRFLHSSPTCLPLDSASLDVACLGDILADAADPRGVVDEVYRVLKPGGKVLALAPAYYDVDYWYQTIFPWQRWLGWTKRVDTRVGYSARRLRRLFEGFIEHRVHKRQLRRSEVPHIWRFLPLSLLQRMFGRTLILKAFKPLSAISTQQMAAA